VSDRLFVLTGAPGSGKSAILDRLASELVCVPEPAREILAEQRGAGGRGTPEQDPSLFTDLLLARSIDKHKAAARRKAVTLFDRGIPDCVAYAVMLGADPTPSERASVRHRYDETVLLLEPWEDIYTTDEERRMSFSDTIPFHQAIIAAYERSGYDLRAVPRDDVSARGAFVLGFIRERISLTAEETC
jgi:predicted ATPase